MFDRDKPFYFFQLWRGFWRGIISIPTKTYLLITRKSLLNQRKNFIFILQFIPSLLSDSVTLLGNPDNDTDIQRRSIIGGIAIFVGGILVGYIVDGVIIYATGQPSAEWIARGMRAAQNYLSKNPKHKSTVHVTKDGAIMGGGGRGF